MNSQRLLYSWVLFWAKQTKQRELMRYFILNINSIHYKMIQKHNIYNRTYWSEGSWHGLWMKQSVNDGVVNFEYKPKENVCKESKLWISFAF